MKHLEINNLCFAYNKQKQILKNFSLSLEKGQMIVLCGKSGSGKSTIFNLIIDKIKPTSGSIDVGKLSIVFQDPYSSFHPNYTILNQIKDVTDSLDKLNYYLEKLELSNSLINKKPNSLSGGQLQRCSILRAVLMKPDILLIDEPTSALDNIAAYDVMNLILSIKENFGIILITHDKQLALWCDTTIINMENI
ncbi:MAG: peptide ABC transporter ATP-binding protein [Campylobacteraceae bacterium 4484_166]|nr:MAG: peptide ABC transporter ATP-binding protein [Campylobacteraceae bacterium 4484_166]